MRKLFLLLLFLYGACSLYAQDSPHGEALKTDCAECHNPNKWEDVHTKDFNHKKTRFPLVGQHKTVACSKCHPNLNFSDAPTTCSSCHKNLHQQTVGTDCARCHTPNSWLVTNVSQIHQQSGFPLVGAHATADCQQCHTSGSNLRFDNVKTDCYSCHRTQYASTTNPNHTTSGLGTDCARCHNMAGKDWAGTGQGYAHGFFPLTGGHNLECILCHKSTGYTGLSPECASCHMKDYNATTNPSHKSTGFSTQCQTCHNINSWANATFDHDKQNFPIYSGSHKGTWSACTDCHANPANYTEFSCLNCHDHNKASTDASHRNRSGYVYNSANCLSCHPRGKAD